MQRCYTAAAVLFANSTQTLVTLCVQGLEGTRCKLPFVQGLTSSFGAAGMMLKDRTWLADLSTFVWLGILQQHCSLYHGFKPLFLHLDSSVRVLRCFDSKKSRKNLHNGALWQRNKQLSTTACNAALGPQQRCFCKTYQLHGSQVNT